MAKATFRSRSRWCWTGRWIRSESASSCGTTPHASMRAPRFDLRPIDKSGDHGRNPGNPRVSLSLRRLPDLNRRYLPRRARRRRQLGVDLLDRAAACFKADEPEGEGAEHIPEGE